MEIEKASNRHYRRGIVVLCTTPPSVYQSDLSFFFFALSTILPEFLFPCNFLSLSLSLFSSLLQSTKFQKSYQISFISIVSLEFGPSFDFSVRSRRLSVTLLSSYELSLSIRRPPLISVGASEDSEEFVWCSPGRETLGLGGIEETESESESVI